LETGNWNGSRKSVFWIANSIVLHKNKKQAEIEMVKRCSLSNSRPLWAREKPSEIIRTLRKTPISRGYFVLIRNGKPFLQCTLSLSRKNTFELKNPSPNTFFTVVQLGLPWQNLHLPFLNPKERKQRKEPKIPNHDPFFRTRIANLKPPLLSFDQLRFSPIRPSLHAASISSRTSLVLPWISRLTPQIH